MLRNIYDKKHPPIYGTLNIKQFEKLVNHKSFPICKVCENPIYNPLFYPENNEGNQMCGPCFWEKPIQL